jgi:hypothetical protein
MDKTDTSSTAEQVVLDIYRRMPVTAKGQRICEAYRLGQMLAMAGLKQLYPHATEQQLCYLWAKQHLGEKLFKEVYGELPDE